MFIAVSISHSSMVFRVDHVYIIVYIVGLVLVLNIEIVMYIYVTLKCDHYEQFSAKFRLILYAMSNPPFL
jgi:hypothetical protein